ncbi:MAG: type II toxin-antitoxin system PemK/MazF family toxin [Deltaproteobacteria bacterium]|nr:type II toxin-antitoxin system PemK/MazF family toxin [Deltaproteobacteria bacterium]
MKIKRGHLMIVDFNPRIHTKPGKVRPAVVIQSDLVSEAGYPSTIVVPTTSQVIDEAGFLRLRLPQGTCGLEKESDLLIGQLIAVANLSFKKDLGPLPVDLFQELERRLALFLDLK